MSAREVTLQAGPSRSRAGAYDRVYRSSHAKRVTIRSFENWARYFLDAPQLERGHLNGNEISFALQQLSRGGLRGKHILDYCCGVGRSSIYFALCGARVSAFDASAQAIEVARQSARLSGVEDRIDFSVMSANHQEYASGVFDAAYCQSSLHIVIDDAACADELARVLKPGASAVFCEEPLGYNLLLRPFRLWRRARYRNCGGRELKYPEIRRFGEAFACVNITHFNLLCQIKVLFGDFCYHPFWRGLLSRLDAFDRRILSALPFMRRFAGKIVVEFVARGASDE